MLFLVRRSRHGSRTGTGTSRTRSQSPFLTPSWGAGQRAGLVRSFPLQAVGQPGRRDTRIVLDLVNDVGNNMGMKNHDPAPAFLDKSHQEGDVHLLREIMRTHQAVLAVFSREVGMPASRLALMRLLAVTWPKRLGVMEIARQLGVNAAAVTRQVQEMEEERLVVRRADARDKRRVDIQLSAKGRKMFEELHGRSHRLERSLEATIPSEEMRIAARVLAALRGALDTMR